MKKMLFLIPAILSVTLLKAQNVGIGTNEPLNKFQVQGNLFIGIPTSKTSTAPTGAQTKTMINGAAISFASTDSTGRIYDPGGPSGNYLPNLMGEVNIDYSPLFAPGIEIIVESMNLGTGDSLIIEEYTLGPTRLLAVGNGYTTTGKWLFNSGALNIIFKSNADANTGSGFSLLFRRLYDNSSSLPDVSGMTGKGLFFNTKNGSFRSGRIDNSEIGFLSTAMGSNTEASGDASTAMGYSSHASGQYSTALGFGSIASGDRSTAIGTQTNASGDRSTAMGDNTNASGNRSTAMGNNTDASGANSTALGNNTISRGYAGLAIGMYNNPILFTAQTSASAGTPLFIVGNGDNSSSLSNAFMVRKDGNVGIGTDLPDANLHIKHVAGGGLILENANDNTKWRIYSASGDNNLTFYNNAGTEIADIDDVTGTFNALSDARYKKDIGNMPPVLSLLMQLKPKHYHFNWQQEDEQKQIGFLSQDAYQLFPELVSYSKEKDLYKMNYAGFSTVAIKAIQEQQVIITGLQKQMKELRKQNDEMNARLERLETLIK